MTLTERLRAIADALYPADPEDFGGIDYDDAADDINQAAALLTAFGENPSLEGLARWLERFEQAHAENERLVAELTRTNERLDRGNTQLQERCKILVEANSSLRIYAHQLEAGKVLPTVLYDALATHFNQRDTE